jgi:hypothetical protein
MPDPICLDLVVKENCLKVLLNGLVRSPEKLGHKFKPTGKASGDVVTICLISKRLCCERVEVALKAVTFRKGVTPWLPFRRLR